MNIVMFGLDDTAIENLALSLSGKLKMNYVNAEKAFSDYIILNEQKKAGNRIDDLEKVEKMFLKQLLNCENSLIYIPNDAFISNENYKIFKNTFKIYVECGTQTKIMEELGILLKSKADTSVSENNLDLVKIKNCIS